MNRPTKYEVSIPNGVPPKRFRVLVSIPKGSGFIVSRSNPLPLGYRDTDEEDLEYNPIFSSAGVLQMTVPNPSCQPTMQEPLGAFARLFTGV
jgi:hypothetical protein